MNRIRQRVYWFIHFCLNVFFVRWSVIVSSVVVDQNITQLCLYSLFICLCSFIVNRCHLILNQTGLSLIMVTLRLLFETVYRFFTFFETTLSNFLSLNSNIIQACHSPKL